MVKSRHWIGIDLGGTWVRAVITDGRGRFLQKKNEAVDKSSPAAISKQIIKLAHLLCDRQRLDAECVEGVGIAAVGPLMQEEGALVEPTNLPFDYVPLTKPIAEELGVPAFLHNDATAAALGESTFGSAKGIDNFVYVTISTGIGAGVIVNGTLLLGKDGNSHEVGHFVIDYEGRLKCGCGRHGHWEAYCSGKNIPNYVRMRLGEIAENIVKRSKLFERVRGDFSRLVANDLFAAAKKEDTISVKLVDEIGVLNAIGFANVINAYDPSLITVGGTVALRNMEMILSPITKHVRDFAVNRIPRMRVTGLGDDIGLYGAIAVAQKYVP